MSERHGFYGKIHRQGHLRSVPPSMDMKRAYQRKSESYIVSARILFENGKLEEAVSMIYYSMFYMVLALLFRTGIKCENHSAAIYLLEDLYGLDNSAIVRAKIERIDKQYYIDFSLNREDVDELMEAADDFNAYIMDYTERMKGREVESLRHRFQELVR